MNPQPQPITLIVISERGKARRSSPRDAPGRLRGSGETYEKGRNGAVSNNS
jgi:hypothetical protein